jgi:hypothetical protein
MKYAAEMAAEGMEKPAAVMATMATIMTIMAIAAALSPHATYGLNRISGYDPAKKVLKSQKKLMQQWQGPPQTPAPATPPVAPTPPVSGPALTDTANKLHAAQARA